MKKLHTITLYSLIFTAVYFSGTPSGSSKDTADTAPSLISPPDKYEFNGRELITFVYSLGSYDKVRLMIDDNILFASPFLDYETDQTSEQVELHTGLWFWKVKGIGGLELESPVRVLIVY